MKDGICPKCGSDQVYTQRGETGATTVFVGKFGMSRFHAVQYICTECGYLELYAPDNAPMSQIRRFWHPVLKPKRG